MARITDLDSIENEQVNSAVDLLHLVDVSSETSVDKKITVAKFHKTAPDATTTERGFVSNSAQSFSGSKTFTNNVDVEGNLTVAGNIYQNGSSYETHAEKLFTKKDMIYTRDGAQSALAAGDYSGITAKHYDADGNDGMLAFDKNGIARVGDVGDTQPILTRAEEADLTNGQLLTWDSSSKKAIGKSIDSTVTAGSDNPVSSSGTKNYVDTTIANTIGAGITHNIPRIVPKDITSYVTDGTLWKRLNGTDGFTLFEDIYVGDYWQMSRPITTPNQDSQHAVTGTDWVTIAGINTLAGNGDSIDMWQNHLVMIPGKGDQPGVNYFGRNRMNPTDTTVGGYYNSELHQSILGAVVSAGSTAAGATVNQQLYAEFGSHLKTTRELLTNNMGASLNNRFGSASGATSGWGWYSCQSCLMSEVEVFGATIWSSSGYDTGNAKTRLPLFHFSTKALNNRWSWYWLKDIASAALFCGVAGNGESSYGGASSPGSYVRPRFVLGA